MTVGTWHLFQEILADSVVPVVEAYQRIFDHVGLPRSFLRAPLEGLERVDSPRVVERKQVARGRMSRL